MPKKSRPSKPQDIMAWDMRVDLPMPVGATQAAVMPWQSQRRPRRFLGSARVS